MQLNSPDYGCQGGDSRSFLFAYFQRRGRSLVNFARYRLYFICVRRAALRECPHPYVLPQGPDHEYAHCGSSSAHAALHTLHGLFIAAVPTQSDQDWTHRLGRMRRRLRYHCTDHAPHEHQTAHPSRQSIILGRACASSYGVLWASWASLRDRMNDQENDGDERIEDVHGFNITQGMKTHKPHS